MNNKTRSELSVPRHRLATSARRGCPAGRPFGMAALLGLLLAQLATFDASAATSIRQDTTNTLDQAGAWDVLPTAGDIVQWSTAITGGNGAVAIGNDISWLGIQMLNPGQAITIGATPGKKLTLGTSGIDMTAASQNLTINADVILGGAQAWDVASGQTLTVGGEVTNAGFNLTIQGAGDTIFNSSATFRGAGGLIKSGSGVLTLAGANSHSSGVTLNTGTLNINNWASLGNGAGTFVINGGTIDNTSSAIVFTTNQPITINGDFAFTGTKNLTLGVGAVTLGTAAGVARTVTVNGGKLTIGGAIANGTTANSLVKEGSGELILGAVNSFTGGITNNNGTLTIVATQGITGGLTLNAGTLNANSTGTFGTAASTFTINGGTIDNTSGTSKTIANNNPVTINADFAAGGTQILSLGIGATTLGTAAGTSRTVTVNGNQPLTIGGDIANGLTANSIIKEGGGTLILGGTNNSFTGSVTVNNGTLTISSTNAFAGTVTLNPGAQLNLNNASSLGVASTLLINGGTLDNTSGAAKTLTNAGVTINGDFAFLGGGGTTHDLNFGTSPVTLGTAAGTSRTITVNGNNAGNLGNLTIGGGIADGTTANSIIKAGNGTLTLSNGTFTGGVTLNAGRLNLNNVTALGASSGTFVINGGVVDNTSATPVVLTANQPITINSDFTYFGTRGLGLGNGAVSLGTAAGTSRTITANTAANSLTNALSIGGVISDGTTANSLIKNGNGGLTLGGANTFTGGVTLNNGLLNLNNAQALGAPGATFTINGGTLDNTSGAFVIAASYPVVLNNDLVFLGGSGTTHDLYLNAGSAMTLGTAAGTSRTITVNAGLLGFGNAIGNGTTATSLVKSGAGTLYLDGANTYTGATVVNGGVLQLNGVTSLPGGIGSTGGTSALTLAGGVIGLGNGDFQRALGTGVDQVQFTGSGGFAAFGADRNVNLGGAFGTVTWASGSFVPNGSTLVLGSGASANTVNFQNPIALNGATRTVQVDDGSAAVDAVLSGALTGTGSSGLTKTGNGALSLTAANTYAGPTTNLAGALILSGASGAISSSSGITLANGATLTITNTSAANNTDRIGNSVGLSVNGGTINFGNDASAANFSETVGTLTLNRGALTLNSSQAGAANTSGLTLSSISRASGGGTVLFSGTGFGVNTRNQVLSTTALNAQNVNGILPYALINDGGVYDLAVGGTAGAAITKYAAYNTGAQTTWVAANNARPLALASVSAARSLSSLVLDNGINVVSSAAATDRTITFGASGAAAIVQTGGTSTIQSNTTGDIIMAFGANEAIFNTIGTLIIQRGDSSGGLAGSGGMTKTGPGLLVLGAERGTYSNAITGALNLNQGTLEFYQAGAFGQAQFTTMNFNGGNFLLHDATNRSIISSVTALNLPITVNADSSFTIDHMLNVAGTGGGTWTQTYGNMTVNNNPVFTVAGGTNVSAGTTVLAQSLASTLTLNSPVTFNLLNPVAGGTTRLSLANITDNGNTITVKGNGALQTIPTTVWSGTGGLTLDSSYTGTVTLSNANTFTGPMTVNGGTLSLAAANSSSSATLNGGTMTIAAQQGFTNGVTINGGTLNINDPGALGTTASTFTINGGTVNNTSGTVVALTANQPVVINGDFLNIGSVYLGAGAVSLGSNPGTNRTITVITNLAVEGIISDGVTANGLVKQGAGILYLGGANTFTGPVTVNGGSLRLGNNTALGTTAGGVTVNSGATLDLTNNITVTGESLVLAGTGLLSSFAGVNTWAGPINVNNSEFSVSTGAELNLTGVISGTGGVEKTGNGILRLDNAANDYTGTTIVKAGWLVAAQNAPVSANGAFGNSASPVLLGDTLSNNTAMLLANSGVAVDRDITVQAGSTGVKYLGSDGTTGTAVFNGAITLNDNLTLTNNAGGPVVINGLISGSGKSISKTGTGAITLTAANTAGGTLTVSAGDLILAGANGSVSPSSIVSTSIQITGTALGTSLVATNSAASNKVNRLGGGAVPITMTTAAGNTATLSVVNDGSANIFRENLGPLTLSGTAGNIVINTTQAVGGTNQLTFASLSGTGTGFTLTFNGTGLGETFNVENEISFVAQPALTGGIIPGATINGSDNATVVFNPAANNGLGGYAVVVSSIFDGNFTQTFPVAQDPTSNSAPFTTTWNTGVNANPDGPVRLLSTRQINSLKLTNGAAETISVANGGTPGTYAANLGVVDLNGQSLYLESGTLKASFNNQLIQNTGGTGALIAGNPLAAPGLAKDLAVNVSTNSGGGPGSLIIAAVIADNGVINPVGLAKTGVGTLMLSNINTYSTNTTVSAGTLKLGVNNAIPDGLGKGNVTVLGGATLDLNGLNDAINGLSGIGIVDNSGGGTSTLRVGSNNASTTFGGALQNTSGTLNLAKTGTGTLTLTNASTITGTVTVEQGILNIRHNSAFGTSSGVTVNNGAQLQVQAGTLGNGTGVNLSLPLTLYGVGTSPVLQPNSALVSSGGTNTWSGPITLGSDAQITASSQFLTLSGGVTGGFNLAIGGTGTGTVTNLGVLSQSGQLIKAGTNTLALGGANTYAGDTVISNGLVRLIAAGAIPDGPGFGNVNLIAGANTNGANTNAVLDLNGISETINGLNGGALALITSLSDPATLTVGGNNASGTYGGIFSNSPGNTLSLTKIGTGTQTLSVAQGNFTGVLTVQDGVLRATANSANALGAGLATLVLNGGELQLANDSARAYGRNTTVGGDATITPDTLTAVAGVTKTLGTLSIGASILTVKDGGTTASGTSGLTFGAVTLTGPATLNVLKNNPLAGTTLTLGSVNLNGNNLTNGGTGTTVFSSLISGNGNITKNGTGTNTYSFANNFTGNFTNNDGLSTLAGANTFTGGVTINGGLVNMTAAQAYSGDTSILGGTNKIGAASATPNGAGKGNFFVDLPGTLDVANNGTINGLSGTGTVANNTGTASRVLTVGSNDASSSFSGTIQDGASTFLLGLTKVGNGILTLAGLNTYTSNTLVNAGELALTGSLAPVSGTPIITVASGAALTESAAGIISGPSALTVSGTALLAGANTYSGATLVSGGFFGLSNATALPGGVAASGGTSALILTNGGIVGLTTTSGDFTRAPGTGVDQVQWTGSGGFAAFGGDRSVNFGGVAAPLTWATTGPFGGAGLVLSHSNADSKITFVNPIDLNAAIRTVTVNDGTATVDAEISGALSGATGGLIKTGNGKLQLTAANTYAGGTQVRGGTLQLAGAGALASQLLIVSNAAIMDLNGNNLTVTSLGFGGATNTGAQVLTGLGTLTLAGNVTFSSNSYPNTATITGNLNLGSSTRTFTVADSQAPGAVIDLLIDGPISGAGGLTKAGAGLLKLLGTDTYDGNTTVTAGTLQLGSSSALPSGVGKGNVSVTGTLDLNTFSTTINGLSGAGTVDTLAGGTPTLTVGANDQTSVFSGIIQNTAGTLGVTKTGSGALTLSGPSTYTGVTRVDAGTLIAGADAPSGSAGAFGNATSAILVGNTTGSSDAALLAASGVTIGRDVTVQSGSSGTKSLGASGISGTATFSGALTLNDHVVLTAQAGATADFTGSFSELGGARNLTNTGGGTIRLSAANSITGGATINGTSGLNKSTTLELGVAGALGNATSVAVNGGTLLLSGAAGDRINDAAGMTLNGGTFNTGGLSESLGTLTLTADSYLDFAAGASILSFLNSSAATWNGGSTLWVTNWSGNAANALTPGGGTDQLIFGSDNTGLTGSQIAQIKFWVDWGGGAWSDATILANGEVVPVPEPATIIAVGALAGLLGWRERRRLRALAHCMRGDRF